MGAQAGREGGRRRRCMPACVRACAYNTYGRGTTQGASKVRVSVCQGPSTQSFRYDGTMYDVRCTRIFAFWQSIVCDRMTVHSCLAYKARVDSTSYDRTSTSNYVIRLYSVVRAYIYIVATMYIVALLVHRTSTRYLVQKVHSTYVLVYKVEL